MVKYRKSNIVLFSILMAAAFVLVGAGCEKRVTQPAPAENQATQPETPEETATPPSEGAAMPIVPSAPGQSPVEEMVVTQDNAVEIVLDARNFLFSQTELRVNKGDRVKVTINVVQGFHDWVVDEFNARTAQVGGGKITSVEFVADKTGTFEYYCSVGKHRQMGMKGRLVVE